MLCAEASISPIYSVIASMTVVFSSFMFSWKSSDTEKNVHIRIVFFTGSPQQLMPIPISGPTTHMGRTLNPSGGSIYTFYSISQ